MLSKAFTPAEQGPLRWSGFLVDHPALKPGDRSVIRAVVFWFWVAPNKRVGWKGWTRVPDAEQFEKERIARGEIEEERHNFRFPIDMTLREAKTWLDERWAKRCAERLGFVPEWLS